MAIATVQEGTWTNIVTTTTDTAFQNRSVNHMYITTEDTTGLAVDEGFYLAPNLAIIVGSGLTVSAITFRNDGEIYYMPVA